MVLPWVPPTATQDLNRISSASISARRTIGMARSRAAASSGLSAFTAEEMTTTLRVAEILDAMADLDRDAELAQARDIVIVAEIRSLNGVAERLHDLGNAAHADAAYADEVDGASLARKLHGSVLSNVAAGSVASPVAVVPETLAERSTRSASRSAASGRPRRRAEAAWASRSSAA